MMGISAFSRWCLILLLSYTAEGEASVVEKKLVSELLDNYSPVVRPVANISEPVTVRLMLTLMQLLELCGNYGGQMKTNIWRTMEWNDASLVWDPSAYANITELRIPYNKIWHPDVYVYNSALEEFDNTFHTLAVVRTDGNITVIHPQILTSTCKFSYSYFPFDEQKCEIKYGSWTYDGGALDLILQSEEDVQGDVSSFIPNAQWYLIGMPARRNAVYYACCPHPYIDVTFVVHVRRRGEGILEGAKKSNIFIFVTLFLSFLIPPASGHKITFAILHLINSWIPLWYYNYIFPGLFDGPDRGGPLMYYFNWVGIVGALGLIANILTVSLYHNAWEMPDLIRSRIVKRTGKGISHPGNVNGPKAIDDENAGVVLRDNARGRAPLKEWIYIAIVVDRISFVIFILAAIIIWITCFPTFTVAK